MADNYEITKKRVEALFCRYDHEAAARKFSLRIEPDRLYVPMLDLMFRMDRETGYTDCSGDGFVTAREAGFNEVLTIMDVLCDSAPGCALSGTWCGVNDLDGVVTGTRLGNDFWQSYAGYFDAHIDAFRRACELVGGLPLGHCDAGYQLPLFPFLPVRVMLWQSDDEFPVSMKLLFDRNTLRFMKYETTYYAMGFMLHRLKALCETFVSSSETA